MSNEQILILAKIVLINDEKLEMFSKIISNLIEEMIKTGSFSERSSFLLSVSEQLSAFAQDGKNAREQLRSELGLT